MEAHLQRIFFEIVPKSIRNNDLIKKLEKTLFFTEKLKFFETRLTNSSLNIGQKSFFYCTRIPLKVNHTN